jgi:hypothetical protein
MNPNNHLIDPKFQESRNGFNKLGRYDRLEGELTDPFHPSRKTEESKSMGVKE